MTKNEKPRHGCKCRCGGATSATYLPGHDAKHLARLFKTVVETENRNLRWEAYRTAVSAVSPAMANKLRKRFVKHYANTDAARRMVSAEWQNTFGLFSLIKEADPGVGARICYGLADVAALAVAAGWDYNSVLTRRS